MAVVSASGQAHGTTAAVGAGAFTLDPLPSGVSATEAVAAPGDMASGLRAGLNVLSQHQVVTFSQYVRVVLPLDGFVFWVRATLASPATILAALGLPTTSLVLPLPPAVLDAPGSLHIATTSSQLEDENFGLSRVVFTSEVEVADLSALSSGVVYIAELDGVRFAFSQRSSFYKQAGLWHYQGDAVYPAMLSQMVDGPASLNVEDLVVSNSLPIWLGLSQYMPMYPSYLTPDNIVPPYASVHIAPEQTVALQATPYKDQHGSTWQLTQDRVTITAYGLRNNAALDFLDAVAQSSLSSDAFGLMNMPVWRDEKRQQNELGVIAMKKTVVFDVNYYQTRMRSLARQLILSCIPTFNFAL